MPYYFPVVVPHQASNSKIRIAQINVLATNHNHEKVIQFIKKTKPDIIGFEEVSFHWAKALNQDLKHYPYRIIEPDASAFGLALFSKIPLTNPHIETFGHAYHGRKFPSLVTTITIAGKPTTVIVTHPLPPMAGFAVRNSQLSDLARRRPNYLPNLIVIGDLNTTPWSPYFQSFIQQTKLKDSQLGFGVQPSWQSPLPFVLIPIDHILLSERFTVLNRYIGSPIGSDHLPVVANIQLQ